MSIRRSQRTITSQCNITITQFINPSNLSHYQLLRIFSHSESLPQFKQIHQQIIVSGSGQTPFLVTKLVQLYADCGNSTSAQKMFDGLPQPNVFAWTAILGLYLGWGEYIKCCKMYKRMRTNYVSPDNYVFPKILRVCRELGCLESGMQIHKDILVFGYQWNLQVSNSLIDMYSKLKNILDARRVFDQMAKGDLFSWNSMISGYVYNNCPELAIKLYDNMLELCIDTDIVTSNTVMDAYFRIGECDKAQKIFDKIKTNSNIISWTTLISGYSRNGNHETSLRIFRDMVNEVNFCPDMDCLSSVLASCRHSSALTSGREIHSLGIKSFKETAFYNSAGASLLIIYAKCCHIHEAKSVFDLMDKSDAVTWNAMILGFIELGFEHMALDCFNQMQKTGVICDQTTLTTILPVCDLKFGKQIHAHIRRIGFDSVVPVLNALIHMYSKCGCIRSAYTVFSNTTERDLVTWNAMIDGFAIHGLGQAALNLLQEMEGSDLTPDSMTLTSLLTACTRSGLVNEGIELFNKMTQNFGFNPTLEHYTCVVDMLARAGRLEDALRFIRVMPLKPNKQIWGSLLDACRAQQNIVVGNLAAKELIRLEPEEAGHYVTLSNIYARAGRWDDAVVVRKKAEQSSLPKPAGESWTDNGI